jgi:lysophospholipase L1-like esterase
MCRGSQEAELSARRRAAWCAAAGFASLFLTGAAIMAPSAYAEDTRPTAIVSLGDSAISGEGAGSYEPGTRGENGDWCHRSIYAMVHRTQLAQNTINLACSGADSANVSLADTTHYTEGSQARRLIDVARVNRVTTVLVQVGANDDPAFADTVLACVGAWINPFGPSCSSSLSGQWPGRLAAMAPKVERAVNDVRTAMTTAGYASTAYNLVVVSYASPFTERMDPLFHGPQGCPIRISDARWGAPRRCRSSPRRCAAWRPGPAPSSSTCPGRPRATRRAAAGAPTRPVSGSAG